MLHLYGVIFTLKLYTAVSICRLPHLALHNLDMELYEVSCEVLCSYYHFGVIKKSRVTEVYSQYTHTVGVVIHCLWLVCVFRDMKPDNILLDDHGKWWNVYVCVCV